MLQIYTQRRTAKGQWPQPRGAVIMAPGGIERLGSMEDRGHNSKTEPPYYFPPGQTRIQVTSDFCPLTSSNPQRLPSLSDPHTESPCSQHPSRIQLGQNSSYVVAVIIGKRLAISLAVSVVSL